MAAGLLTGSGGHRVVYELYIQVPCASGVMFDETNKGPTNYENVTYIKSTMSPAMSFGSTVLV